MAGVDLPVSVHRVLMLNANAHAVHSIFISKSNCETDVRCVYDIKIDGVNASSDVNSPNLSDWIDAELQWN